MPARKRWWLLAAAGLTLFLLSLWRGADYAASDWWYVPGYVGLTTAFCSSLIALRLPRKAATWGAVAGAATGVAALFWALVLWSAGAEAPVNAGYTALLLTVLAIGAAGLASISIASSLTALTLVLVLLAAGIEAFAFDDGDGNVVGLTLVPAVMLTFALWRLRTDRR